MEVPGAEPESQSGRLRNTSYVIQEQDCVSRLVIFFSQCLNRRYEMVYFAEVSLTALAVASCECGSKTEAAILQICQQQPSTSTTGYRSA